MDAAPALNISCLLGSNRVDACFGEYSREWIPERTAKADDVDAPIASSSSSFSLFCASCIAIFIEATICSATTRFDSRRLAFSSATCALSSAISKRCCKACAAIPTRSFPSDCRARSNSKVNRCKSSFASFNFSSMTTKFTFLKMSSSTRST